MKTAKPFGYPVNNAGLPRNWCTILPSDHENLPNLSPQEIAHTYWLLESIHIDYAYSINYIHKTRKILLSSDLEPSKRIATPPSFYYNATDPDGIQSTVELELQSIAHSPEHNNTFHLNLKIQEQDEDALFLLSSNYVDSQWLIDSKPFVFLNRQLDINLYGLNGNWPGSIEYIHVDTEYYVI